MPNYYSGVYYPYQGYPSVKYVDAAPFVAPAPFVAAAPFAAKTTYKTVTAEADPFAKTPADTKKFDLKEKSYDVYSPLGYSYLPYAPYTYPLMDAVAAGSLKTELPVSVEAKNTRAKRQIFSILPIMKEVTNDMKYKTVDFKQAIQPNPFSNSDYYPYTFPFYNGFYGYY